MFGYLIANRNLQSIKTSGTPELLVPTTEKSRQPDLRTRFRQNSLS